MENGKNFAFKISVIDGFGVSNDYTDIFFNFKYICLKKLKSIKYVLAFYTDMMKHFQRIPWNPLEGCWNSNISK